METLLNITVPVFNRFELTQKTLLALRKTKPFIPYVITVVDNGSEARLRERLVAFREAGVIDNLFLLPRNMGISVACNVGWQAVDAQFYMKLDNDMTVLRRDWLERLFRLWSHGKPLSSLGPALEPSWLTAHPGTIESPDGILGICPSNLPGGAIIIPRAVSDVLGMWSEDYGLYGAEDGDYGTRMQAAGFPQYYYDMRPFFRHNGDNAEYGRFGLDKAREHGRLFKEADGGIGLFLLNFYLYNSCIRSWKVPPRYRVAAMDGYDVSLEERPEYAMIRTALERSKEIVDSLARNGRKEKMFSPAVIERLKKIWRASGEECAF